MKIIKKILMVIVTIMLSITIVSSDILAFDSVVALPNKEYSMVLTNKNKSMIYKINLKRAQRIDFTLTTSGYNCNYNTFKIYNNKGEELRNEYIKEDNVLGVKKTIYTDYLSRGDYTIVFDAFYSNNGKLTWSYSVKNLSRITQRTHNIPSRAPTCGFRKYYYDHLGSNDSKNFVKINVPANGLYEMRVTSTVDSYMYYSFYNTALTEISGTKNYIWINQEIGKATSNEKIKLNKGTYYISFVSPYLNNYRGVYKWMMRRIK